MLVTNVGNGPRGLRDDQGRGYMLAPGQSIEISVSAKQEQLLRKKSCFKIQAGKQVLFPTETLDENTVPQENGVNAIDYLRADAESLGIQVDKRWGEKRLQAEIDKVLSDAVHDTDSE